MGLNSSSYYVIGPPINYTSIYGYPKRRFEVFQADEQGNTIAAYPAGEIKEEPMLDENGDPWGRCFYTKNLGRPNGKYRFYPSPEALIVACGGKVVKKPAAEYPIQAGDASPGHPAEPEAATLGKDAQDAATATEALSNIDSGGTKLVKGDELEKRLSALEAKIDALTPKPRTKVKGTLFGRTSARKPATARRPSKSKKEKGPPPRKKKVTP